MPKVPRPYVGGWSLTGFALLARPLVTLAAEFEAIIYLKMRLYHHPLPLPGDQTNRATIKQMRHQ